MSDIKPTDYDIVIPVAVYNDMRKKIEHLNADTRRKGKALAKALKRIDELEATNDRLKKENDLLDKLRVSNALASIDRLEDRWAAEEAAKKNPGEGGAK